MSWDYLHHISTIPQSPKQTPKFFSSLLFSAGWGHGSLPTHSPHTGRGKGLAGPSRWELQEHLCRQCHRGQALRWLSKTPGGNPDVPSRCSPPKWQLFRGITANQRPVPPALAVLGQVCGARAVSTIYCPILTAEGPG